MNPFAFLWADFKLLILKIRFRLKRWLILKLHRNDEWLRTHALERNHQKYAKHLEHYSRDS